MSRKINEPVVMSAKQIRSELAKRKISKRALSQAMNINYNYLTQILNDMRVAKEKRREITNYLKESAA